MDGRKDQIILVEQRIAGAVAGGVRRIEREFGQEALAARIGRGDLRQAAEDPPGATSHRRGCAADAARTSGAPDRVRPASPPRGRAPGRTVSTKSGQCSAAAAGGLISRERLGHVGALGDMIQHPRRRRRPRARQQLHDAKAGDPVARIFRPAQERQHILDVRGLEKLQAAEFHERNVAAGQFHFERPGVMRGAEQHRLRLERDPLLAAFQHRSPPRSAPDRPRRAR